MDTERSADVTEKSDVEVKPCPLMSDKEDHDREKEDLTIKQNGMSEHAEFEQEIQEEEDKLISVVVQNHDKQNSDSVEDVNMIEDSNRKAGVVDSVEADSESKDHEKNDIERLSNNQRESKQDNIELNLPNRTAINEANEDCQSPECEKNNIEQLSDNEREMESEDIELNTLCKDSSEEAAGLETTKKEETKTEVEGEDDADENCINDSKKVESSNASKLLELESEDSSKDSVDSSISNISKPSSPEKEDDDNSGESVLDTVSDNVGSDITSAVEISQDDTAEKKHQEANDVSGKIKNAEVDDNENVSVEETEKELEVTDASQSSNNANDMGVKPAVQQPTVPNVAQVSNGSLVMSQPQITVHQQQTGYITKVGNQHIFVPVSSAAPGMYPVASAPGALMTGSQALGQSPTGAVTADKAPDLSPKSSLEMIELMKWEMQNRVPDNYNWSVAFHPKKDELSSISSYLLELGHDVVKEAVYKDIILIQTKKKELGKLKESEVESLEKMKTVYENTKKKVEHLDMKMLHCNYKRCKYQTESKVVMNHHKDHPHIEPPWDWQNGYLCCALCDFRTKQPAAFSFHMEAVHKAVAKMPDKPGQFPCEMCPLDLSTKNKLEKHRVKCMKTFKLNVNLQPYYHDVNFCMKTCYYKPKKPVPKPTVKKPDPRAQPQRNQPMRPIVRAINPQQMMGMRKTLMQPQYVARPPPPLQRQPISLTPIVRAPQAAFRQGVPQVTRSPVVRQMIQQQKQNSPRPQGKEMSGFEVCELCGGYVKDRQALRIHFYYAHKVEMPQTIFNRPCPPLTCDVCQSKFWTTQGLSKHKTTLRHYSHVANSARTPTPTHKCFMCSRMVSNLFIHVEQTHGMTMKELVAMRKCIMCGITTPDRKQLEVHMSSAHGVLIKATDFLGPEKPTPPSKSPVSIQPKPGTPVTTATPNKGKSMVRNNLCVFCQIQFADNIQLTMHCIKIHATCSACGMVVASSKHLQNHHCKKMMRDCVICGLKKLAPDAYALHIKKHVKPCSVNVDKMSDKNVKSTKEDIKKNYKPAVISLDSDSGGESDVELVTDDNDHKAEKGSENDNDDANSDSEDANESDKSPDNDSKKVSSAENLITESNDDNVDSVMEANTRDAVEKKDQKSRQKGRTLGTGISESETVSNEAELADGAEADQESKNGLDNQELDSDEENEFESANKMELNQTESRKRKSDSSDKDDTEESKRQRTTADSEDDRVPSEDDSNSKDNIYKDSSDSESKDKETSDSQCGNDTSGIHCENNENSDNTGSIKRPFEDDEMHESGADSGTESDQASKRRKVAEEA